MAGVFKAGRGYYYPVQPTTDTVVIDNSIKAKPAAPQIPQDTADPVVNAGNTESTDEISVRHRQELEQEKDKITSYYRAEGEKALAEARERAQKILSDTEQQAQDYAAKAKAQAEAIFEKSKADGFAKGHEDGYAAGLDKCRDMLSELKKLSEQIVSDKAELFDSYEVEIFDTVMEIVNRITLNSLGQKDKAVVKKTIKEAGKSFRGSEYVKLTLSKTDVSEEMAADTDYFKKLFTNVKNVEVEVLKDAPSGTVIIDNGSEITDAGISTQLKMIEELGRGKYRRAPSRKKAKEQEEPLAEAVSDSDDAEKSSE
ncbi:MAG: hypothetical protein ACI4JV_10355 [Ruminiclostridium sp.]